MLGFAPASPRHPAARRGDHRNPPAAPLPAAFNTGLRDLERNIRLDLSARDPARGRDHGRRRRRGALRGRPLLGPGVRARRRRLSDRPDRRDIDRATARRPRRAIAIVEGESLVNDGTALVLFKFAAAAVVAGSFSLAHAAGDFVWTVAGGIAAGLLIGAPSASSASG